MSDASSASPTSSSSSSTSDFSPSADSSTSASDPTSSSGPLSHSAKAAAIAGTVGALCVLATVFLLALLFWRRRKRRVLRSQQMAIRRMTIVDPSASSSPPTLPSPFSARGHHPGLFSSMSKSDVGNIEMSTGKNFRTSRDEEAGLPWRNLPAPVYQRRRDRVDRERERTVALSSVADSASVFSSKQSEAGDGDRMVLVDGVYVLALERGDDPNDVERETKPARP